MLSKYLFILNVFCCLKLYVSVPQKVSLVKSLELLSFKDEDGDGIRGIAGKDYPAYKQIPKTSFTCPGQKPGYYADTEAGCQVFHFCFQDKRTSFLCGNGTIFNQKFFTCDWWYSTSCSDAPNFYHLNSNLYKESKFNNNDKTDQRPFQQPKADFQIDDSHHEFNPATGRVTLWKGGSKHQNFAFNEQQIQSHGNSDIETIQDKPNQDKIDYQDEILNHEINYHEQNDGQVSHGLPLDTRINGYTDF